MKTLNYFLSFILFCSFLPQVSAQEIWDDAILYYSFDGSCSDIGPNGLNGTAQGGGAFVADRFGVSGKAISFDGMDDYIDIPDEAIIECDFPVSFSFWVKVSDLSLEYTQFFATDQLFNEYGGFRASCSTNSPGSVVANYGNAKGAASTFNRKSKVSDYTLIADEWCHIVCVFQGPLSSIVYINGMEAGGTYTGDADPYVAYTLGAPKIGTFTGNFCHPDDFYYLGEMDDFGMWNRCLTYQEIQDLYNYSPPGGNNEVVEVNRSFKAFPVPVQNRFSLNCNSSHNNLDLIIIDINGKQVYSGTLVNKTTNVIPVETLTSGVYVYEVLSGNKFLFSDKFIKE